MNIENAVGQLDRFFLRLRLKDRVATDQLSGLSKGSIGHDAFAAGIGDYKIVTTLCPGGKERMRRLMSMVQTKRFDPTPLLTHSFKLDQIVEAYEYVETGQKIGNVVISIKPSGC